MSEYPAHHSADPGAPTLADYVAALGAAATRPVPEIAHEGRHAFPGTDWAHDTMPGFPALALEPEPEPMIPPCRCETCEWAVQAAGGYDGQCRCETCRYGTRPGAGVVLYSRPGSASLLWAMAVRDEVYEDIEGLFDAAWRRARQGFEDAARHARLTLAIAGHRTEAVNAAEAQRAA